MDLFVTERYPVTDKEVARRTEFQRKLTIY